jgi:hypothetical protein
MGAVAGPGPPSVETWHSLERISHPQIREFAAYWRRKRGDRRAPSRSDIDPFELRAYLPHIFILDVVPPDGRLKIRLVGTEMARAVGGDHTGRFVDEVTPPDHYPELHREIDDVVRHFVLRYKISDMAWKGRPFARYHRLMTPLSNDQSTVNMVFGIGYMIRAREVPIDPLQAAIEITPVSQSRILAAK